MTNQLTVDLGDRSYPIRFAPLETIVEAMRAVGLMPARCLVVTDARVGEHYLEPLMEALRADGYVPKPIVLEPGEETKAYGPLHRIYDEALGWGVERGTPVVALGGGVVGDLAGFAAATLLRGLPLVHVPTSLVAQVDSAIGGKTGINHAVGKNLIGAFHQPRLVLADAQTLQTLPEREWTSGLAEVVKHGLIADASLVRLLETHWEDVLVREPRALQGLLPRAAAVKVAVVAEDEREAGRRAILNFGHTFGHAIERVAGYGRFTHGEAVALGMRAALHLSHALHPDLDVERLDALVARIPTPPGLTDLSTDALLDAARADKKAAGGRVRYVVLRAIGSAYATADATDDAVRAAWAHAKAVAG